MCRLNSLETSAVLEAPGFKHLPLRISPDLSVLLDLEELYSPKLLLLRVLYLRAEINFSYTQSQKGWVVFSF